MKWGRGFFRAWVVVSVLWMAGVGYVEGPQVVVFPREPALANSGSTGDVGRFEEVDAWEPVPIDAWAFIIHMVGAPFGLLVFGFTFAWIVRGFRG